MGSVLRLCSSSALLPGCAQALACEEAQVTRVEGMKLDLQYAASKGTWFEISDESAQELLKYILELEDSKKLLEEVKACLAGS